jgi:Tfp pilus assembly protein PilE
MVTKGAKRLLNLFSRVPTKGFTTVELLSTLIIAGMFLAIFYNLYITADAVSTRSARLVAANEVTYRKLQQYENKDFQDISTPGGTTPTQIEDFVSEMSSNLPTPVTSVVNSALLTPTLKAVNVKTTYGTGGGQQIIEYTTYIQESGVGR